METTSQEAEVRLASRQLDLSCRLSALCQSGCQGYVCLQAVLGWDTRQQLSHVIHGLWQMSLALKYLSLNVALVLHQH